MNTTPHAVEGHVPWDATAVLCTDEARPRRPTWWEQGEWRMLALYWLGAGSHFGWLFGSLVLNAILALILTGVLLYLQAVATSPPPFRLSFVYGFTLVYDGLLTLQLVTTVFLHREWEAADRDETESAGARSARLAVSLVQAAAATGAFVGCHLWGEPAAGVGPWVWLLALGVWLAAGILWLLVSALQLVVVATRETSRNGLGILDRWRDVVPAQEEWWPVVYPALAALAIWDFVFGGADGLDCYALWIRYTLAFAGVLVLGRQCVHAVGCAVLLSLLLITAVGVLVTCGPRACGRFVRQGMTGGEQPTPGHAAPSPPRDDCGDAVSAARESSSAEVSDRRPALGPDETSPFVTGG